ncbi:3-hydroxyacyl-CoA dehydrogenase [Ureibacillus sp. FSL K6-8385]|uniref:3-hydroxyacyl-CoA dehydrogenase n=1 Tax=Ureibacillus terrenus TaxID=118246 RepID=A0A540V2K7_9BACL|nr:3-hydroxyacyl-CoA dehydrogenase [Ureibacillus terrenus]MED3663013.1 3-hydroxyacyl-CoA dehydrogenase [Ureibacillus terrenus]MED3765078.1 3-hydroxyacyl-CoA dehydrogenase [Ureibacillus terrenus]TQE90453.1 3-hydroxyacyl-CoA dehydrogenase [Ureibacillus terrenus]
MDLQNKVAVVTGGASGLGLATVEKLVEKGAKVFIFDLNEKKAKDEALRLGDQVRYSVVDVSDDESVQHAIRQVIDTFGAIHICVNCAGIGTPGKTIGKKGVLPLETFRKVIDVNLIGTFNVLRLAANEMKNNEPYTDSGERGVIINTASVAAFDGQMGQAAYAASKAGIAGMTLPLSRDLSEFGIRVNTIAPGVFMTPLAKTLPEKVLQKLAESVEFPKRLGRPSEYAELATFLMENEYINGEVIRLDGAIRMSPR